MTNVEKLQSAKMISPNHRLTDEEKQAINNLSDDEVNCLVSSKQKLGDAFVKKHLSSASSDCFF